MLLKLEDGNYINPEFITRVYEDNGTWLANLFYEDIDRITQKDLENVLEATGSILGGKRMITYKEAMARLNREVNGFIDLNPEGFPMSEEDFEEVVAEMEKFKAVMQKQLNEMRDANA